VNADSETDRIVSVETALPRPRVWLLPAAGLLVAATVMGAVLAAPLALDHPLWLIALNPWPRHLLLVAPHSPMVPFIALASLRGLASCVVTYELGRHYGARAGAYMEGRSARGGATFRAASKLFGRWSPVLLTVFPGATTSVLAGMGGLGRTSSLLLSFAGLVGWACVNYRLGAFLAPWTAPIVRFLSDNMLPATLLCILAIVLYRLTTRRKVPPAAADAAPLD
jgi:membrane protein DedA with SNARE-associated domain